MEGGDRRRGVVQEKERLGNHRFAGSDWSLQLGQNGAGPFVMRVPAVNRRDQRAGINEQCAP